MTDANPHPPIRVVDWKTAEQNAAAYLRRTGFPTAHVTVSGADSGVDVRGRDVLAQVKYQLATVGRPTIQALAGAGLAEPRKRLCFFTFARGEGTYSRLAVEYADAVKVALFVYNKDGSVKPANRLARKLNSINKNTRKVRQQKHVKQTTHQGSGGRA